MKIFLFLLLGLINESFSMDDYSTGFSMDALSDKSFFRQTQMIEQENQTEKKAIFCLKNRYFLDGFYDGLCKLQNIPVKIHGNKECSFLKAISGYRDQKFFLDLECLEIPDDSRKNVVRFLYKTLEITGVNHARKMMEVLPELLTRVEPSSMDTVKA